MSREVSSTHNRGASRGRRVVGVLLRVRGVARHLSERTHVEVFHHHRTDAHLGAASVGTRSRLEATRASMRVEPSYTASPLAPEAGERAVGHAVVARRAVERHVAQRTHESARTAVLGVVRPGRVGGDGVFRAVLAPLLDVAQVAHEGAKRARLLVRLEVAKGNRGGTRRLVEFVASHVHLDEGLVRAVGARGVLVVEHRLGLAKPDGVPAQDSQVAELDVAEVVHVVVVRAHHVGARETLARLTHHLLHALRARGVTASRHQRILQRVVAHGAHEARWDLLHEHHAVTLRGVEEHRVGAPHAELLEHHQGGGPPGGRPGTPGGAGRGGAERFEIRRGRAPARSGGCRVIGRPRPRHRHHVRRALAAEPSPLAPRGRAPPRRHL